MQELLSSVLKGGEVVPKPIYLFIYLFFFLGEGGRGGFYTPKHRNTSSGRIEGIVTRGQKRVKKTQAHKGNLKLHAVYRKIYDQVKLFEFK